MTDGNMQAVTTVGGYPVFGMHGDYVAPRANQKLAEYGHERADPRATRCSSSRPTACCRRGLRRSAPARECWACGRCAVRRQLLEVGGDFTAVDRTQQARFAHLPALNPATDAAPSPTWGTASLPVSGEPAPNGAAELYSPAGCDRF